MQLLRRKFAVWWWAALLSLYFSKTLTYFSIPSTFSRSLFTSFDFAFLPRPCGLSCPVLARIPSALGFKPLRASFPSSKSFKAECVRKAVFGGEGSELDRNRYVKMSGCFRRKSLTFSCPRFLLPHNSRDEGLFVRQGQKFVVAHKCCSQH